MVSQALFCLHRDHAGKGFKPLPTPLRGCAALGRGVFWSITLQSPPAAAAGWWPLPGDRLGFLLARLMELGTTRTTSLVGSDPSPLLFLGVTELWTPSMLLLQDPIVPAVPLQPPASRSQTPGDFRHRKRISTFPTCKHSSNSSSLHLESLGKAVLLLLAKG